MRKLPSAAAAVAFVASGCASLTVAPRSVGAGARLAASESTAAGSCLRAGDIRPHRQAVEPLRHSRGMLARAGGGRPGTGYVGLAGQALFPSGDALDDAWGVDLNYTQNVAERVSVELSLGFLRFDAEGVPGAGELRTTAVQALAQLGRPFGVRWYAGAGVGWWMNDLSAAADAADSLAGIIVAGADLPLSTKANLAVELRYAVSSADLSPGGELELDSLGVRLNCVFLY